MKKIHNKCRNCHGDKISNIINLGDQPISSIFPKNNQADPRKGILELVLCNECGLVQLTESVESHVMYGESYGYLSSTSKQMVRHLRSIVEDSMLIVTLSDNDFVLDIGCNDGTLLDNIENNKITKFGIDPSAERFESTVSSNITLINDLFSEEIIRKYTDKKFKIIFSIAMFYDVDDPNKFAEDINNILDKNGIWVVEIAYLPLFLKNLSFDQICHEHVCYYSLTTINDICIKNDLMILDFSTNEINGGSARIFISKKNAKLKKNINKINNQLKYEKENLLTKNYNKFNRRVYNARDDIKMFLESINCSKKTLIGYGASTKGNIVQNFCQINRETISYICDSQESKFNKITPGSRIKIISKEQMRKLNPDYLFVFIWHLRKEVIQEEMDFLENGGSIVFPLPRLHIVTIDNYRRYINSPINDQAYDI